MVDITGLNMFHQQTVIRYVGTEHFDGCQVVQFRPLELWRDNPLLDRGMARGINKPDFRGYTEEVDDNQQNFP